MRLLKLLVGDLIGSRVLPAVFVAWDGVCCVLAHGMDIWIYKVDGETPGAQPVCPLPLSWGWQGRAVSVPSLCLAVMAYMQFVEDYSEPQPSMFYQTPQNEHIYQKKNMYLREVYGINDSFISLDASQDPPPQDLAPPPALPPKQRQLVSDTPQGHLAGPPGTPGRATRLPGAALLFLLLALTGRGGGGMSHWCYHTELLGSL